MNFEKYTNFSLQDFLADDDFIQWAISPNESQNSYWQAFEAANPQKKEIIDQASTIIKEYRQQDFFTNEAHKEQIWQRIEKSIAQQPVISQPKVFNLRSFMRVAAAIIIIAGTSFWLLNRNASAKSITVATAFGEVKTITLPDESQVTLNGNSSITYLNHWKENQRREVSIKGEGYFNVTHLNKDSANIKENERFIVHCGDVNIEVLGTTFNVKARRGKTDIALITGKIRIDYTDASIGNKPVVMAPGDYLEYVSQKIVVAKRLVKPAQITNWRTNEISFTNANLKEIAETLQDNYGYTVNVKDSSLLPLKIEGDISVATVADLLDVVSTTLNIKIEQTGDKHINITK
ncbi:MAG: FecR domain-containing protein [Chitinophagaceae bacterium]